MIRVLLSGCNGHMGQVLTDLLAADPETETVAGIDIAPAPGPRSYPVFAKASDCTVDADVCIDFSNYKAVDALLDYCTEKKLPLVLCTTALTEETLAHVKKAAETIAVLRSANMSLGINLLLKLVKEAAALLAPAGYDMEVVEAHHNRKIDAPSGTALALADSMNEALGNEYHYVYSRADRHEQRDPKEIGISSVRAGTIVGEHSVLFAGPDEVIELKHSAYSRSIFGSGAISAAKYLAGKPAGMYDMSDVIG